MIWFKVSYRVRVMARLSISVRSKVNACIKVRARFRLSVRPMVGHRFRVKVVMVGTADMVAI